MPGKKPRKRNSGEEGLLSAFLRQFTVMPVSSFQALRMAS